MEFEPKKGETSSQRTPRRVRRQGSHLASRSITNGSAARVAELVEGFTEIYNNTVEVEESGLDITVSTLSKTLYGNDYDAVLVSASPTIETSAGKKTVHMVVPVVIEDNSNVKTPRGVTQDLQLFFDTKAKRYYSNSRDKGRRFYLPTETLESKFRTSIAAHMGVKDINSVITLDAIMIPEFVNIEDESMMQLFAGRGIDPILDYWYKLTYNDVMNVKALSKDSSIRTNFFSHTKPSTDALGVVIEDTFTLQVFASSKVDGVDRFAPNERGVNETILETKGTISLIPSLADVEVDGRIRQVEKLLPVVTCKDVLTQYTLEYALLTIASLGVLADDRHWMDILIDTATENRDPGNMLKAIGKTPKPFTKKGVSREAKEQVLFDNCTEGAAVAIDISEYSLMSGAFSVVQAAARGGEGSTDALNEIVQMAVAMCTDETTGKSTFDPNFDINNILFATEMPGGYFTNTKDNTKHSLASIDTDYIASTDPKYLDAYLEAETSEDGIETAIAIYNDIGLGNARLNSIRRRVIFTADFLSALGRALGNVGFSLELDAAQAYKRNTGRGYSADALKRFASRGPSSMARYASNGHAGSHRAGSRDTFVKRRF